MLGLASPLPSFDRAAIQGLGLVLGCSGIGLLVLAELQMGDSVAADTADFGAAGRVTLWHWPRLPRRRRSAAQLDAQSVRRHASAVTVRLCNVRLRRLCRDTPGVCEIETIREECERLLAGASRWAVLGAAARRPPVLAFARHAIFERICAMTIGLDADLLFDGILFKPALGGKELRWHQDAAYGRTDPWYVSCWVPLSAGEAESGGLWVAPGSHRLGLVRHSRKEEEPGAYAGPVATMVPRDAKPVDVSPGQVVVLHSEVLHRSGPNNTTIGRLACQYGFVSASTRILDAGLPSDRRLPLFRASPKTFA